MSASIENLLGSSANDEDNQETREWIEALQAVIASGSTTVEGRARAHFLLEQLLEQARQEGIDMPFSATTGYVNTIEPDQEARCPGNLEIEGRLRAYMRWNAMAMVVKANRHHPPEGGDLGGHIGSFASLANMFAAGYAVMELLARIHGYQEENPPHSETLISVDMGLIGRRPDPGLCPSLQQHLGRGDCEPMLGLPALSRLRRDVA